jgi:hypothetical protein
VERQAKEETWPFSPFTGPPSDALTIGKEGPPPYAPCSPDWHLEEVEREAKEYDLKITKTLKEAADKLEKQKTRRHMLKTKLVRGLQAYVRKMNPNAPVFQPKRKLNRKQAPNAPAFALDPNVPAFVPNPDASASGPADGFTTVQRMLAAGVSDGMTLLNAFNAAHGNKQ